MKNMTVTIIDKLNNLYKIYEEECWRNENGKIIILLENSCISFYYDNNLENVDEFCLSFAKLEKKIYQYISLMLFNYALGDVYIYQEGNNFYNLNHKPYLSITVCDDELLEVMSQIVVNQDSIFIGEYINNIYKRTPFKINNNKFIESLDMRIDKSRKILRSYHK